MLPIEFEGSQVIGKPKDMTDEECMSIHALLGRDESGVPFFLECWKPSYEDIEAIKRGEPIWLKILGVSLPPIAMFTINE